MKYTYMFIGAHPDDADIEFGGTAILLKELGHNIVFVSATDGSAGHQSMSRKELADRRYSETQKVAEKLGITYVVMDTPDGELVPDLETRHKLIRVIREHKPDVIISPRLKKMQSLALHESQIFEWLPFINGYKDETPAPTDDYLEWMKQHWGDTGGVSRFAKLLNNPEAKYLEVFECCEYGSRVTPEIAKELFPFGVINLNQEAKQ